MSGFVSKQHELRTKRSAGFSVFLLDNVSHSTRSGIVSRFLKKAPTPRVTAKGEFKQIASLHVLSSPIIGAVTKLYASGDLGNLEAARLPREVRPG